MLFNRDMQMAALSRESAPSAGTVGRMDQNLRKTHSIAKDPLPCHLHCGSRECTGVDVLIWRGKRSEEVHSESMKTSECFFKRSLTHSFPLECQKGSKSKLLCVCDCVIAFLCVHRSGMCMCVCVCQRQLVPISSFLLLCGYQG